MRTFTTSLGLLLFAIASNAQDIFDLSCFSLSGSTACPAFQSFYISIAGNQNRYPFLTNITDIQSFDSALTRYVHSSDLYLASLGCNYNKAIGSASIPYARYSLSLMCATLIQDSVSSLPCNYQHNLNPPPLCQSTCFEYVASVDSITSNNLNMCPNQLEQAALMPNLNSSCEYWTGLNGTSYNCIIGLANEPECGFADHQAACAYCHSTTDSCCQAVTGCQAISIAAIIGIVLGSLAGLAMVGTLFFFLYARWWRRRKTDKEKDGFGRFMMMNNTNESGTTSKHLMGEENTSYPSLSSHPYQTTPLMQDPPLPPIPSQQQQRPPPHLALPSPPQPLLEEFYQVKHPYPPQMGDELSLHIGDIVCVAMNFDDGWALGFNVTTGLKGVFPVVCVAPAPEELLEQLLLPTTDPIQEAPKPIPDMKQGIPRRTASIMRSNYDYRESDSPTSPTHHTPFFDLRLPQPEPALIETYEMHRKNNRVSKQQEPDDFESR
ncbi:hypothetical protein EDC96DRAFT_529105 [Choanephora cucurbitarum]|nr:hypothetical protein EDC96DRAFT_529105 [Choanephora cucurbitarum]